MNRLQIIKELRRHRKLSEKRSINFAQNKAAKWLLAIVFAMIVFYLVFFAIIFALIANDSRSFTSVEFIMAMLPFTLFLDFMIRFMAQQTPAQLVKPYILLPISKYSCVDSFIFNSMFNWGNLTWMIMLIPYALMSVVFSEGVLVTLGILLSWYLFLLANSQWYAIVRTLINDSLLYWLIPIGVYLIVLIPAFMGGIESMFEFYAKLGTLISEGSLLPYLIPLALLIICVIINRKLQYVHIEKELAKTNVKTLHTVSQFSFLEKFGETGQYLKLEIKSILRNKNPRKSFIFASVIVLLLSLIISFSDIYDTTYMTNFWCIYNYVVFGGMLLVKVMCNEGNYIDCLMMRHENILKLLQAKYYFFCIILIIPFALMFPTILAGKWSIFMLISYAVFTAGFQYFILMQMAVYNKQSVPLNTKLTAKNGMENNYFQIVAELVTFFIPVIFVSVLQLFFSENVSYLIMFVVGGFFVITHKMWLRNIYQRMMKKKYVLLEGFRSSR